MNPLYEYSIYFAAGALLLIFLLFHITKLLLPKNNIKISKGLSVGSNSSENSADSNSQESNAIRAPKQSEFNLEDPNEIKYLSLHLTSKKDASLRLNLLQTKISAYGLKFEDGVFLKNRSAESPDYYIFNGEEIDGSDSGTFQEKENINLISMVLPQNGQKNTLRSFEEMLALARNLSTSFDMRLLDEHFNGMSEQTITDYKERATNLDLKLSSYGS